MGPADSPLERAIRELRFTMPLPETDARYVQRRDKLGQRLLNRVLVPSVERLLLAGPAGCGKSTELRRVGAAAVSHYNVVLCACDRDLDLHRPTRRMLLDHAISRVLEDGASGCELSTDILRDVERSIGVRPAPGALEWRSTIQSDGEPVDDDFRARTLARLCAEIGDKASRVLLLVDGLEKVPSDLLGEVVLDGFVRSPALAGCQSLIVIPHWSVYGWRAQRLYEDTEVFEIPVDEDPAFVADVLERRAPGVFYPEALREIARLSGGVVRDGLQLGHNACRAAMDALESMVKIEQVEHSQREMLRTYVNIFSDDPERAKWFLTEVRRSGELPGDERWRDRMLASGAVLPRSDGTFRVHPVVDDPRFLNGVAR
jgi:energy-coupling factor transporter ATP-binding protein EcfA2